MNWQQIRPLPMCLLQHSSYKTWLTWTLMIHAVSHLSHGPQSFDNSGPQTLFYLECRWGWLLKEVHCRLYCFLPLHSGWEGYNYWHITDAIQRLTYKSCYLYFKRNATIGIPKRQDYEHEKRHWNIVTAHFRQYQCVYHSTARIKRGSREL